MTAHKLTDLPGADVLPKKVMHGEECIYLNTFRDRCYCSANDVNKTIDAMSDVGVEFDVEELAECIDLYMERTISSKYIAQAIAQSKSVLRLVRVEEKG